MQEPIVLLFTFTFLGNFNSLSLTQLLNTEYHSKQPFPADPSFHLLSTLLLVHVKLNTQL